MMRAAALTSRTDKPMGQAKDAFEQPASPQAESREDLQLAGRVERALNAAGYMPLRKIEVFVQARMVTLTGRVPSYYLKQVAQTAALGVPGIHQLQNDLDVT